jgi:glyoxylase-like metal-dependent hydrolase (beta-lactamase superfamily II)
VSFFSREHGVLFSGDSIQITGKKLLPSSGGNTWDAELAQLSFQMQLALHPTVICGGHGIWVR